MIHVTENEKLLKRSEHQAEINTRKSIVINYQRLSCNINRDSINRNKHSVDRYLSMKVDTKVNNEHEFLKIR